jgi:hypothetical protein
MKMNDCSETFRGFTSKYLQRKWAATDGLSKKIIADAESRLEIKFPPAMKGFYLSLGNAADFCSIHNFISHPKDVVFDEGYLMFMDENQSVVSWGIKKRDLDKSDPKVWQRNNGAERWYSERKTFSELLISMFDWYQGLGVWKK